LVLLVGCLAARPASAGELLDGIIAVVNKDVVLYSDLREMYDYVAQSELRGLSGEQLVSARASLVGGLVDGLIAQKLLEQAMERSDIRVEDREVETAIADVAKQNGLTVERLFEEVERQGMGSDDYRQEMQDQLRRYQFMNLEVRGRISISDEDIRSEWQRANASAQVDPAWRLQRILLSVPAGAAEQEVAAIRSEGAALIAQISQGKEFSEVAKMRSDDPSTSSKGGEAGLVKPNDLGPAFAKALEGVPVGQVVQLDLPSGTWLLRIGEEVNVSFKPLEEVRDAIARELYDAAMERELGIWTEEERRRSHVEVLLDPKAFSG
jgi:peptidyl-prolyl cis-trans isomerase SurA